MNKSVREQVRELLEQRNYARLVDFCEGEGKFWKELRFRLYDTDEKVCFRAIETIGHIMKRRWESGQQEKVREYIRHLFWTLTDESGGIGWNSPQTIAEIIAHVPPLADSYGSMMISYTLEEPPLIKSGLWGIGRLGELIAEAVDYFQDSVLGTFQHNHVEVLGLAAWATGEVGFKPALPFLEKLLDRNEPVRIYINGDFQEKPLGQWVREAIEKIEKTE